MWPAAAAVPATAAKQARKTTGARPPADQRSRLHEQLKREFKTDKFDERDKRFFVLFVQLARIISRNFIHFVNLLLEWFVIKIKQLKPF